MIFRGGVSPHVRIWRPTVAGRGALKDGLCLLLAALAPAPKEVGPRQDALGDLGPVGLPNNALGKEACMAAEQFVGGMGHADAP